MKNFKPIKGKEYLELVSMTVLVDILLLVITYFAGTYELLTVVRIVILIFNCYQLYYIILYFTLTFQADDHKLYINGNFGIKKITISFKDIEQYFISQGPIKGIRISGYSSNNFAIGRTVLDKIGTTYMFVTSNKNIIYLKTAYGNFALSIDNIDKFKEIMRDNEILMAEWEHNDSKYSGINKEKKFVILLSIASIIIIVLTVNPCLWYLNGKIPVKTPLTFDGNFLPVKFGTAKEFLFKQVSYGVLNMGVLFCMYYAAYFCAKYDKKTAYKFMYVVIILASAFLFMQLRILYNFR